MSAPTTPEQGLARAWGWVAHLREGGTTPWRDWLVGGSDAATAARHLPGAQQLELLRRLNELAARERVRPGAALAERVLSASMAGRGRPDRLLAGADRPTGFGLPPVDPGDLPRGELLRVAATLLAEDVVAAGVEPVQQGLLRPWRVRHRLVGDLWLTAPAREHLLRKGRPPGGRDRIIVVVARDLPGMLADTWTAHSFDAGVPPWEEWVAGAHRRGRLYPRADPLRTARWWAERVGPAQVHVVLDAAALARVVGVRRLPTPPHVSADGVDLARRLVPVMGLLAVPERRAELLRRGLAPRLAAYAGPRLAVPDEHRDWVAEQARRQRDGLLADGYPVHGDPDVLLAEPRPGGRSPEMGAVFELALRMLLDGRRER